MKNLKAFAVIAVAMYFTYTFGNIGNTTNPSSGKGIDTSNIDRKIKPGDDFYLFANGNWLRNNPVPSTESTWGSFNELFDQNNKILRNILEEASRDQKAIKGTNRQKIGDFYFSAMDSVSLNKMGAKPLQPELDKINNIKAINDVIDEVARLQRMGLNPLFSFYVYQDLKLSTQMAAYLSQGGIGLPDRDYYFKKDIESETIRKKYHDHIVTMFTLLGDSKETAEKNAATIFNLETKLAEASMTRVEQRNMEAQYNKKTMAELKAIAPTIDWNRYFTAVGLNNVSEVIISQPEFIKRVESLIKETPVSDWKTYLKWNLINETAEHLSDDFVNQDFNFYSKTLKGAKQLKPRWKRSLAATDGALGEALGEAFVAKTFSPEAKQRVNEMVDNLTFAFKKRVHDLDWMSPETKTQATVKLDKIMRKLAYPDQWRDYSALEVTRDSYVMNALRANEFEFKRMVNKMGKPIDRTEWGMSPPTVNAYYNPTMNEIVFPVGIMQPPFFNPAADDAVNYASMGAVIGHELTHGFDDQGSQFDADGNMKDWWTEEDKSKFVSKTKMVETQFNNYAAIDTFKVNGALTLGENIADLGGLTIAYEAYKKSLEGKKEPEKIDGLTADQRFFLGWAQIWRVNYTDQALKQMLVVNPHSPGPFRVNGPLSNMEAFYKAFDVKEGDKMYKPVSERAQIW